MRSRARWAPEAAAKAIDTIPRSRSVGTPVSRPLARRGKSMTGRGEVAKLGMPASQLWRAIRGARSRAALRGVVGKRQLYSVSPAA